MHAKLMLNKHSFPLVRLEKTTYKNNTYVLRDQFAVPTLLIIIVPESRPYERFITLYIRTVI